MYRKIPTAAFALAALTLSLAHVAARADTADTPAASEPSYSITANVTLATQYRYRGLMQTDNKPAIQGGFDFTHSSGFYLGNWNSNISWLSDSNSAVSAPVEMDFYGGWRGDIADGIGLDVGALKYYYPGDYPSGFTSPDTAELYAGISHGPISLKYSYAVSNLFGFAKSKGSQYVDLSGNFDTGFWGLTVNTHVGYQYVHNVNNASYYDWKLGVTKDLGKGLSVAVAYLDTNADKSVYTNAQGRDMGRGTVMASLSKTF
jgi:uncharacterized protein (TIGR02001 family)